MLLDGYSMVTRGYSLNITISMIFVDRYDVIISQFYLFYDIFDIVFAILVYFVHFVRSTVNFRFSAITMNIATQ